MAAHVKHVPIYLATIAACYFVAWTAAFVFLNGSDFAFYFEYLGYFWRSVGGERPMFTGIFSIALFIPLSLAAICLVRRSLKSKNEKSA